jgi:hypothetical protein
MFSGGRELKTMAYSTAIGVKQLTGQQLPIPGLSEAMGYRERAFAQAKFRQFTNEYPDFRPPSGTKGEATPRSPYYDNIEDALYAGNVAKAKALVAEMKKDPSFKDSNVQRALISSMSHRQPIPGGQDGAAFLKWAKEVLPPEDLARIINAQEAYVKAAIQAGVLKSDALRTHAVGFVKKPNAQVRVFNP